MKTIMKYDVLLKEVPQNELVNVKLNDGSLIKCKKIPLSTIDNMDTFLKGVKDGLNIASGSLNFVATLGNTKLFSAVGDPTTYIQNKSGNFLSASRGANGKITGQPGFQAVELSQKGVRAASSMAKVIPWVALAVTVIEVGTSIVLNQNRLRAEQIEKYKKYLKTSKDHINNLWQAMNDYTLFKGDEAHKFANVIRINSALDYSRNKIGDLLEDASSSKKINEHLVFALKTALDVYSFAYLLSIMHTDIESISDAVNDALKNIDEMTASYNEILEKCYAEHLNKRDKQNNSKLKYVQFDNSTKDKKHITKRVVCDFLSAGTTELLSLKLNKDEQANNEVINALEQIKKADNPFAECIRNADELLLCKKLVMHDDKYLYYEV